MVSVDGIAGPYLFRERAERSGWVDHDRVFPARTQMRMVRSVSHSGEKSIRRVSSAPDLSVADAPMLHIQRSAAPKSLLCEPTRNRERPRPSWVQQFLQVLRISQKKIRRNEIHPNVIYGGVNCHAYVFSRIGRTQRIMRTDYFLVMDLVF
jgi:hypothetical protein